MAEVINELLLGWVQKAEQEATRLLGQAGWLLSRARARIWRAGFLAGAKWERQRQEDYVHRNIVRVQFLINYAETNPEEWSQLKRSNPELINRLERFFNA